MRSVGLIINLLRSLQWRLVLIFISMIIVLMIPIGLLLKDQVESSYYEQFLSYIKQGSKEWKIKSNATIEDIYNDLRSSNVNGKKVALVFFNFTTPNKTYTVINTKIKIDAVEGLRSNDPGFDENRSGYIYEILGSENLIQALKGVWGGTQKLLRTNGRAFFDFAYPIKNTSYVLYFRYYSEDWQGIIDKFNNTILSSTLFAIIAALILGYLLSKTITVPIVNIMSKAKDMAEGNYDQVLEVKSKDEIGRLTQTFNYMASALKNNLNEISSEKSKVETILNYMTDGVIAFNVKGEVIHFNPASKKILETDEIKESFDQLSLNYKLGISLKEVLFLQFSGSKEKSINIKDKFIRAYFALFSDEQGKPEGIITVLQDITEQHKLENMRKEFVANVSHELRTPLTSIKSYTETLIDGALDDKETALKFLKVIDSESDRMARLIKDLLQLSSLDNNQMKWNLQTFQFENLVKNSIEKLQLEARSKGQRLECFTIGDLPEITADHDKIEQVVLNILTNALKYTPRSGSISVYLGIMYSDVYIKVTDTGIGIPNEDLDRIFERFYRVDKARSREMGGTGLGLSIAKEIVEAHNGKISVNSNLGIGTEILVRLPLIKEN